MPTPAIDPEGLIDFAVDAIKSATTSAGCRLPKNRAPAMRWFHDANGFEAMADILELSDGTRQRILNLVRERSISVKARYEGK